MDIVPEITGRKLLNTLWFPWGVFLVYLEFLLSVCTQFRG